MEGKSLHFKILLIITLFLGGFFISTKKINAEIFNHLIISEVQITGGPGQTTNDFIELYNPSNEIINLKGYRLSKRTKTGNEDTDIKSWSKDEFISAHAFYLWANSNYISIPQIPNATTTATISDDNGIALRFGKTNEGQIIDALAWGSAENIFKETNFYPNNPIANQSLERNLETGIFNLQASPNPQNSQPSLEPPPSETPQETPPQQADNQTPSAPIVKITPIYSSSDVVINEFISDPSDNEVEWVELFNNTEREIDLENWAIEEGSESITTIKGLIKPKNFFVVENPKGNLNNSGDLIILKDLNNKIIDQVIYGNWDDGALNDNAPKADDPLSVARVKDGQDTDNDAKDFKIAKSTKGGPNLFEEKDESYPRDIIISELLPNPKGNDLENEFIELKNMGDKEIDLNGWQIGDDSKNIYIINKNDFASTTIKSGGYFVIYRKQSGIALNNSGGEKVFLYQPDDNLINSVGYSGTIKEDESYSLDEKRFWAWSLTPTPKAENIIAKSNKNPVAVIEAPSEALINEEIIFDASDSYDPENNQLTYLWNLENATSTNIILKYKFNKIGGYKISLDVKDKEGLTDTASLYIKVVAQKNSNAESTEKLSTKKIISNDGLKINEFLPNPTGSDSEEWIEIYNDSDEALNLLNFSFDDEESGSNPYKISEEKIIKAKSFLIFKRSETKIALNNEGDSVRLLDPNGKIISSVNYDKSKENYSYALDKFGEWQWTEILTPGAENIISVSSDKNLSGAKEIITINDLKEINDLEIGTLVKVQGVVAVEPKLLGTQIFYLNGLQIYCYKKDFPDLKPGDLIEVNGELSEISNEKRIKIKNKDNIKILKHGEAPLAQEIKISSIDEEQIGYLNKITGLLTDKTSAKLFLDDGTDEIEVPIKESTAIKIPAELIEGDTLEISGIIRETKSGYQILPRYQNDIILTKKVNSSEYLTGGINNSPIIKNQNARKYLLLSFFALVIIAAILILKKKKTELI